MPPVPSGPTAADLMTSAPRSCTTYSSVLEAVLIFRDAECGAVPILDDGKPVGILTDRDVAIALAEHPDLASRSVGDLMTPGVVSVTPDATLAEVREKLATEGVRRLLVLDGADQLLGIISWHDIAIKGSGADVGGIAADTLGQP